MSNNDPKLGTEIHNHLVKLGIETPGTFTKTSALQRDLTLLDACTALVQGVGLNLEDDSIKDTPKRLHKMYNQEVFYGLHYEKFPKCTTVENKMAYDEMIAGRAEVLSMCEHHFVPFIGVADVGYIPKTKVLGLSKFNRVVDFFSRRPQIQERLTEQVSAALRYILDTEDVAVVIRAEHMCVKLRGPKDATSVTITSKLTGKFKDVPELRSEFLALTRS